MNWTINLMYAVLLTSVTGTLLFGFWYGIGRLMERTGFLNVVYEMLKAVLVFWVAVADTRRAYRFAVFLDGRELDRFAEVCKELKIIGQSGALIYLQRMC